MQELISAESKLVHFVDRENLKCVADLVEAIEKTSPGVIIISSKENKASIIEGRLLETLRTCDIIHCGLLFNQNDGYDDLHAVSLNWSFLSPPKSIRSFCWKATSHFFAFDRGLYAKLKGFSEMTTVDGALSEFAYRAFRSGAKVIFNPSFWKAAPSVESANYSREDVIKFTALHLGDPSSLFLKFFFAFGRPISQKQNAASARKKSINAYETDYEFKVFTSDAARTVRSFSAVIPTVNRYTYLKEAIDSLLAGDCKPVEVIVVDQTPRNLRVANFYDQWDSSIVRVIFSDKAGQSSARNVGIDLASSEWIFLFDDDSVCWPDCTKQHINLVENSSADISTGLSLAPWKNKTYFKGNTTFYHVAEVLDSGNCFVQKSTLKTVGGFDLAFDRGPGADDDIGKRLYLKGFQIVLNPHAIRTHYKAKTGGLRVHGAWWRNSSRFLQPYPPPTQVYMIQRFYQRRYWPFQILLFLLQLKNRIPASHFALMLLLAPIKIFRSWRAAQKLTAPNVSVFH
jgi:glycosyltransferase involved in cell wall biosynthesis